MLFGDSWYKQGMDSFYTDHWREIEPERLERYERMFQYRDDQAALLNPLDLAGAGRVLDFGCGPGFMAEEIASRVDVDVVGADLNEDFVARANARNQRKNLSFVHLDGSDLLSQVGMVDRLFCKNVLEYVPDLGETLSSFNRTLQPGGEILIVDSDWGFVLVEPWGNHRTQEFFSAASAAFREPLIGRKLPGALRKAGFASIQVRMLAGVDLSGWGLNVLTNMVSYIRQFQTRPEAELSAMIQELEAAVDSGDYMFILPQFLVTAKKP